MKYFCIISFLFFLLIGCNTTPQNAPSTIGYNVPLSHAVGFQISLTDSFAIVTVSNPWKKGETYAKYYLVNNPNIETPTDGLKIITPIESVMVNSTTYLSSLDLLDELNKVKGVCNANYIYNPKILDGVAKGNILDLGDSFNLDIENLLLLQPQAIMTTAYNADDANSLRMKQTGLNIIYNIEWQEPSILGRAEWIKFISIFFNKLDVADSIFNDVKQQYLEAKELAMQAKYKPTIFSGQDYRGTWSMAGGKSYTAQLFRDANALYYYENDSTTTSIPSTIEQALLNFSDKDIWIGTQASTLNELTEQNSKYSLFKAYKNGEVYNINKRMNENGGNDYWESAIIRPDLLLKDMIKVCHPELLNDYELTYIDKLK